VVTGRPTPRFTASCCAAYDTTSTRSYVERRTAEGLSKPEIIRCLKRYVAREIFTLLTPTATAQVTTAA
jgi:ABC-type antimicrobial peptide transport system permease subunit